LTFLAGVAVPAPAIELVTPEPAIQVLANVPLTNCLSYTNFGSTDGLNLLGAASATNNFIRLTPAAQDQWGSVWSAEKRSCTIGFSTVFQFRFSDQGSLPGVPAGADGIAFTIQNLSNAAPATEIGAFPNSVAISLNTFLDYGAGEPSDNFV